jgi:hypothetical protein
MDYSAGKRAKKAALDKLTDNKASSRTVETLK